MLCYLLKEFAPEVCVEEQGSGGESMTTSDNTEEKCNQGVSMADHPVIGFLVPPFCMSSQFCEWHLEKNKITT